MSELKNFAAEANVAAPTDPQFQTEAEKQRRQMGGTFDQVFSPEAYGEGVRRMHRKRKELDSMMARIKPSPWTVFNLMPFPLNVNGVLHSHLAGSGGNQVPACPVGGAPGRLVITEVLYSIKDEGAGLDNLDNYNPHPWDPSILAHDYEHEFLTRMGCGGVVVCEGDKLPDNPDVKDKVEAARKKRNQWLLRKVLEAEAEWSDTTGAGRKNITELHRKAAEVLLHEKILKHQPAWLLATNDSGNAPAPCPGCGEVSEKGATICKGCNYVYDPLLAYKSTLIEYGHIAMTRLSTEQWREANHVKAERERKMKAAEGSPDAGAVPEAQSAKPNQQEAVAADNPASPTVAHTDTVAS